MLLQTKLIRELRRLFFFELCAVEPSICDNEDGVEATMHVDDNDTQWSIRIDHANHSTVATVAANNEL